MEGMAAEFDKTTPPLALYFPFFRKTTAFLISVSVKRLAFLVLLFRFLVVK